VPTEISVDANNNWTPAGDDAARGWLWTSQEYDWKGRTTRTINTDGTDTLASYDGCGCAGGQITTIQSELVPRNDQPTVNARRTQKIYADILGRSYKTEVLNWDNSVYSTVKTTFNGRDQTTEVKQYQGADTSSVFQTTTATFDGHGRLKTSHKPEQQNSNGTPTYTTYNYNVDDRISQMTDARGAGTNYLYNLRGLLEQIGYTVPSGWTIPTTAPVTFSYDALGNRTQMIDGLGSTTYEYNSLSQMTAETRQFTDNLPNAPISGNKFRLEYGYTLSGGLKYYKDPYGQQINYTQDKTGRLSSVTGSTAFAGITNYADNPQYRAWGGLKSLNYGNNVQMSMTYNNKLQTETFNLSKSSQILMNKSYDYYSDGSLRYLQDTVNPKFDRLNTYDHSGRIKEAKSGAEARGQTAAQPLSQNLPFRQSYGYDAFNNLTQRNNLHWGTDNWNGVSNNLSYTYQNNRINDQSNNRQYDSDGRLIASYYEEDNGLYTFDAAGQFTHLSNPSVEYYRYYSGDGRETKRGKSAYWEDQNGNPHWTQLLLTYYIRSTVMGGEVISEVNSDGRKFKTYIKAAGAEIAWQAAGFYNGTESQSVFFEHQDSSGMSSRTTMQNGNVIDGEGFEGAPVETDPFGGNMGLATPYLEINPNPPNPDLPWLRTLGEESPTYVNGQRVTYVLDGFAVSRSIADSLLQAGVATPCPHNDCGPRVFTVNGQRTLSHPFTAYADGTSGYRVPVWQRNSFTFDNQTSSFGSQIIGWKFVSAASNNVGLVGDGIPFEPRRINPVEASILRKTIVKATNNTDLCKKYIADLIQKVATNGKKSADDIISTDIPTLFDKVLGSRSSTPNAPNVNERGGIFITGYGHGSSFSHNYWEWVGGGVGFASLRLEFAGDTPPVFKTLTPDEQFSIRYDSITRQIETPGLGGMTAIHELIHVAVKGIGNDIDLAKAAAELAGEKFDPKDGDIVSQASQYWDDRLNQACGYPSSISRKMTNYKLYK
jgi:YD repeat-containing protein